MPIHYVKGLPDDSTYFQKGGVKKTETARHHVYVHLPDRGYGQAADCAVACGEEHEGLHRQAENHHCVVFSKGGCDVLI